MSVLRVASVLAAVGLVSAPVPASADGVGRSGEADRPAVVARLGDPRIVEASGMAGSRRHPGVLYVVNDSGHGPHVYAVGRDGATRARLTLAGAGAYDWEALAAGPGRSLWVGDIGDNRTTRESVTVYRAREPAVLRDGDVPWQAYRLRYPDGAHDAEALLVHPRTGRVYVATKEVRDPGLYVAPRRLVAGEGTATLRRVGDAPMFVTGGEFSSSGERLVLRDLGTAFVYPSGVGSDARLLRLPRQKLGESVVWTSDGRALLVGSEGKRSAVWRVPLQGEPTTGKRGGPGVGERVGASGGKDGRDGGAPGPRRGLRLLAALVVAGVLAGAAVLRRRRGRGRRY